jgi:hypothetical protein
MATNNNNKMADGPELQNKRGGTAALQGIENVFQKKRI